MYGKLHSACLHGIDGVVIQVEVDLANGLPQTSIIVYVVSKDRKERIPKCQSAPCCCLHTFERFDLIS